MPKSDNDSLELRPVAPAKITYRFRVIGTERTYDVSPEGLKAMRSRKDMEYIGDRPLPPKE